MSTSDSAVLSDKKAPSPSAFDLHSWQGLTQVLKVGKESLHNPDAYSEFRNLVLQYAQRGGDIELRKKIDAVVATFSKTTTTKDLELESVQKNTQPTVEEVPPGVQSPSRSGSAIGNRRMQPDFKKSISATPTPVHPEPTRVIASETPVPHPVPEIIEPTPAPTPVIEPTPEPPVVREIHAEPVPPSPHIEQTPTEKDPVVQGEMKSVEEYKNRITEIKRAVNAHVGNPVSLMGLPNDIGKKYMAALLNALKVTGGGSVEGVDSAMMRLEEAYRALTVDGVKKDEPIPESHPAPEIIEVPVTESVPAVPQEKMVAPEAALVSEITEVPVLGTPAVSSHEQNKDLVEESLGAPEKHVEPEVVIQEDDTTAHPTDEHSSVAVFNDSVLEKIEEPLQNVHEEPRIPLQKIEVDHFIPHVTVVEEEQGVRSAAQTLASLFKKKEKNEDTDKRSEMLPEAFRASISDEYGEPRTEVAHTHDDSTVYTANKYTNKEIAAAIESQTLADSGINPADVAVKQAELSSPAISQSLQQLLHEWSIFSGSGLFGMGPGGAEHPLYLKLAPLSMGEILAGRWEKSDPKVTKVIKQYVDAWRHEQAVAYTINETFEHYLRRVVQRILKRQQ